MTFDLVQEEPELHTLKKVFHRKALRGIALREGKVLLLSNLRGDYKFPGGGLEPSETAEEALKREVKEETGLEVEIFDHIKEKTRYYPKVGVTKDVVYFLAKAKTIELKAQEEEIADAVWVDASDVLKKLSHKSDRKMFISLSRKAKIII